MIDIHCHILPGLDDGSESMEVSLTMAAMAADDGITTIIATPHTDGIRVNAANVETAVREFNAELRRRNIALHVVPGYEIPFHRARELAEGHRLAESRYVLVEFPHEYLPADSVQLLHTLILNGLKPIIGHPERNGSIMIRPDCLHDHIEAGALVQITADSITGNFGPDVQQCAYYLLHQKMVHFIATDSHAPTYRKPVLSKARKTAGRLLGKQKADALVLDNPLKILQDALRPARSLPT